VRLILEAFDEPLGPTGVTQPEWRSTYVHDRRLNKCHHELLV